MQASANTRWNSLRENTCLYYIYHNLQTEHKRNCQEIIEIYMEIFQQTLEIFYVGT